MYSRRKEGMPERITFGSKSQRAEEIKRTYQLLSQPCCVSLRRLTEAEIIQWTKRKKCLKKTVTPVVVGSDLLMPSPSSLPSIFSTPQGSTEFILKDRSKNETKIREDSNRLNKSQSSKYDKVSNLVKEIDGIKDSCKKRKLSSDKGDSENRKKKVKSYSSHSISKNRNIEENRAIVTKKESVSKDKGDDSKSVASKNKNVVLNNVLNEENSLKNYIKESNDQNLVLAEGVNKEKCSAKINKPQDKDILNLICTETFNFNDISKDISIERNSGASNNSSSNSEKYKKSSKSKKRSHQSSKLSHNYKKKKKKSDKDKTKKDYNVNKESLFNCSKAGASLISNCNDSSISSYDRKTVGKKDVFGIASFFRDYKSCGPKNEDAINSLISSNNIDSAINGPDGKQQIGLNCTTRDPTQIFGIPVKSNVIKEKSKLHTNGNSSSSNSNSNGQDLKAKIRVRPATELGLQDYNFQKNSLSTSAMSSSQALVGDTTIPMPPVLENSDSSSLNVQVTEKVPIPQNLHFSGFIEFSSILYAKSIFCNELHLSKISKLSEIIHLAICDTVKKQDSISNASLINSKELTDKEIFRANKDFQYNMRCRAAEFCPLFFCLIKRNGLTYNFESVLVLYCQLCDNLIRIKKSNYQFLGDVRTLMNFLFRVGRYKDELINNIFCMETVAFKKCVNIVSEKLSLEYLKFLTIDSENQDMLPDNENQKVVDNCGPQNNGLPTSLSFKDAIDNMLSPVTLKQTSLNQNIEKRDAKVIPIPFTQLPAPPKLVFKRFVNVNANKTSLKDQQPLPRHILPKNIGGFGVTISQGTLVANASSTSSTSKMSEIKEKNIQPQKRMEVDDTTSSNNNSPNKSTDGNVTNFIPSSIAPLRYWKFHEGGKKVVIKKGVKPVINKASPASLDSVTCNGNSTKTVHSTSVIVTSHVDNTSTRSKSLVGSLSPEKKSVPKIVQKNGAPKKMATTSSQIPFVINSTSNSNAMSDKCFTNILPNASNSLQNDNRPATCTKSVTNSVNSAHVFVVPSSYPTYTTQKPVISSALSKNGINSGQRVSTSPLTTAYIGNNAGNTTPRFVISAGSSSTALSVPPISCNAGISLPSVPSKTGVFLPSVPHNTGIFVPAYSSSNVTLKSSTPSNSNNELVTSSTSVTTSTTTTTNTTCSTNLASKIPTSETTSISSGVRSAAKPLALIRNNRVFVPSDSRINDLLFSSIPGTSNKEFSTPLTSVTTATATTNSANLVPKIPSSVTTSVLSDASKASKSLIAIPESISSTAVITTTTNTKGSLLSNLLTGVTTSVSSNVSGAGKSESPVTTRSTPLLSVKPVDKINRELDSLHNSRGNKHLMEVRSPTAAHESEIPKLIVSSRNNYKNGINVETPNKISNNLDVSNSLSLDCRRSIDSNNLENNATQRDWSASMSNKPDAQLRAAVVTRLSSFVKKLPLQLTDSVPPKPKLIPINTEAIRKNNSAKELMCLLPGNRSTIPNDGNRDCDLLEKLKDGIDTRMKKTVLVDATSNNYPLISYMHPKYQDKSSGIKTNSESSHVESGPNNFSSSKNANEIFKEVSTNNSASSYNEHANLSKEPVLKSVSAVPVKVVKHNLPSILEKPTQSYGRYLQNRNICQVAPLQKLNQSSCSDLRLNTNSTAASEGSQSSSKSEIPSLSLQVAADSLDKQQHSKVLHPLSQFVDRNEDVTSKESTSSSCNALTNLGTDSRGLPNQSKSSSVNEVIKPSQSVKPNINEPVNNESEHSPKETEPLSAQLIIDDGQEKIKAFSSSESVARVEDVPTCKLNSSSFEASVQSHTNSVVLMEESGSEKLIAPPSPVFIACNPVVAQANDDDVIFVTDDEFSPIITSVVSLNEFQGNENTDFGRVSNYDNGVEGSSIGEKPSQDDSSSSSLSIQSGIATDKHDNNDGRDAPDNLRLANGDENSKKIDHNRSNSTQDIIDTAVSSLLSLHKASVVTDATRASKCPSSTDVENLTSVMNKKNTLVENKIGSETSSSTTFASPETSNSSTATASQVDEEDDDVIWVGEVVNDKPDSSAVKQHSSKDDPQSVPVDALLIAQSRLERQCGFKRCKSFDTPLLTGMQVLICSRCRNICYCSVKCQQSDWYLFHGKECKDKDASSKLGDKVTDSKKTDR